MFITNTTKKHVKEYSYLEALRALREGRNTNPAHEDAFKTYLSLIKRRKIRIGIESQLMIWFNYEGSNYGGAICACFFRGFHGQLRSTDYTNLREMGRSTQHARSVGLKKKEYFSDHSLYSFAYHALGIDGYGCHRFQVVLGPWNKRNHVACFGLDTVQSSDII